MKAARLLFVCFVCLCSSAFGLASPRLVGVATTPKNAVPAGMMRVDALLVTSGLVSNRAKAKQLLQQGVVTTRCGSVVTKASKLLSADAKLTIITTAGEESSTTTTTSTATSTATSRSDGGDNSDLQGSSSSSSSSITNEPSMMNAPIKDLVTSFIPKPNRTETAAARSAFRGAAARAAHKSSDDFISEPTTSQKLRTGGGRHHPAKRYSKKNKRGTAV